MADPDLEMVGYQVHWEELELGLMYFNHTCGTTLAIKVKDFSDLYQGEVFQERATDTDQCSGCCLHQDNLSRCPAKCECAYVREVLHIIKEFPKNAEA